MVNAYINILQTLVPLYLVMLLGYAAGAVFGYARAQQSVPVV
jgi:hypothetical protein